MHDWFLLGTETLYKSVAANLFIFSRQWAKQEQMRLRYVTLFAFGDNRLHN